MAKPATGNRAFAAAVGLAVLGTLLVLGAVAYFFFTSLPEGRSFSLVDHNGRAVTEQDFRGKFMLTFFGYTYCPDVCPTELTVMSEVLDILGEDGDRVVPVFISIDPERDTPEQLKDYVENFHPRLVGLTGTPEQVAAAARSFGAEYRKILPLDEKEEDAGDYYMGHSTSTYLTGPNGESLISFARNTKPEAIAERIGKIMKRIKPTTKE